MQQVVILTLEEYEELKSVQSEPDQLLRDTNAQLKVKLDECTTKLEQGSFDNCKIDTPFIIKSEKLLIRSYTDFIILFNSFATNSLIDTDALVFNYLADLASRFNLTPHFKDRSEAKAYRVSLQKKDICQPSRTAGVYRLELTIPKDSHA